MSELVSAEALRRTFHVSYLGTNQMGSAFFIDVDSREYLVTAKHLVHSIDKKDSLQFWQGDGWTPENVRLVGHSPHADISVLALHRRFVDPLLVLEPTVNGIVFSQTVHFLGFPFGLKNDMAEVNNNYPIPFIKKAILSGSKQANNTLSEMYLDGHNNSGFSGGPVIFRDSNTKSLRVCGVISGYLNEPQFVQGVGVPNGPHVNANSGIIVAGSIDYAVRIAQQDGGGAV